MSVDHRHSQSYLSRVLTVLTAVIPPRKNRKVQYHYDKTVYRQRNIIERMFCRLKDWRRIATRFDRNIKNFIAAIALAAAVIWWL